MESLNLIKHRRSIRKYQNRQITRADLETVIQAGIYAPNAGGGQRSMIVGVHNADLAEQIGRMNLARFDRNRLAGSHVSREQPYLSNVYPGDTRTLAGIVFELTDGELEYFHLGVNPIFRESYPIGGGTVSEKGYQITNACIGCGSCARHCPQRCVEAGTPYQIQQEHCLHCGNCYAVCPVQAVERQGSYDPNRTASASDPGTAG